MAWISRSLGGILKDGDDKEEKEGEFWDDPELFDPAQSVRDDLAELRKSLTQSLWGVASFLAPPPTPRDPGDAHDVDHTVSKEQEGGDGSNEDEVGDTKAAEEEAVNVVDEEAMEPMMDSGEKEKEKEKEKLSGMQSDFAELKGGFAKGLSRLSSVIRGDDSRSGDKLDEKSSSQDHGIAGLLKPLIDNVLSDKPVDSSAAEEDSSRGGVGITSASVIDGVSKLASSLFSFDDELDDEDDVRVPGLTDEVVSFARNISLHPETWLDFPLSSDDEVFEMNSHQIDHAYAVERAALRLAALKVEICPRHMSEARFWRIYFVLLHPRLSQEDAELLSTPQVRESRKLLLEQLRQSEDEEEQVEINTTTTGAKPDDTLVVDKDAIPSTVKLAAAAAAVAKSEEIEADDWLHEEATTSSVSDPSAVAAAADDEDDVSFSDLEDDHDEEKIHVAAKAQGWVELDEVAKKHERMGSNDWLTVDKEDAGNSM